MGWLLFGFFVLWIFEKISDSRSFKKSNKISSKKDELSSDDARILRSKKMNALLKEHGLLEIESKDKKSINQSVNVEIDLQKTVIDVAPTTTINEIASSFKSYGITSFWHITHRDNIATILSKGLLSNKSAYVEVTPTDISNSQVQRWRDNIDPIYNREIHEYVPLYINAKNPMLYAKKNIQNELCIIEISILALTKNNFIFTNGNAASKNTYFFNDVNEIDRIPWSVLKSEFWNDFEDGKRKRCSEVLVYPSIESKYINHIYCNSFDTLQHLHAMNCNSSIAKNLFF